VNNINFFGENRGSNVGNGTTIQIILLRRKGKEQVIFWLSWVYWGDNLEPIYFTYRHIYKS